MCLFNLFSKDIEQSIPDIKSICLNCGLEEKAPDFIYDETRIKVKHNELKAEHKVSTIYCNKCGNLKTISKYWLTHK